MATGKATIRAQSAERTKEAQRISSSIDRARHARQQKAAKKAIAQREEDKRIEANIKKTYGRGALSPKALAEIHKKLAAGPIAPTKPGLAGRAERAYGVGREEVRGYEQPAALRRIEETSKEFAKSARLTEVRIGGVPGVATRAVVEATARAGEFVGRLPTGAHIIVTHPKTILPAATIAAYEVTQLPKAAKADPVQFAADVLVMGTLFGAAGKVAKPLKALKPGEALKPIVPKKFISEIKAVDSTFKATKLPLKKVKARVVTKAKQTVKPVTEPVAAVTRKVKVAKIKAKQEVKYKTARVTRPITEPVKVKRAAIRSKEVQAKRIVRIKKMQSKQAVKKELVATKKQLQKLAKDEKAEVELIRAKERIVTATEKVKTHAELSKQISQTRTKIRSLEKTFENTKDLTVKVRIKTAQKQLRQLEAEKIKREMVFEDIKALKQKVRSTRIKTKQVERVKLEASERLKVLEGIAIKSTQRVKVTERVKTPERVKVKEVEKVKELEKVREFERSIEVVRTIEREIERETQTERQRLRQSVKEEVMPELKIITPKMRAVEKKKTVTVIRKVSKEYTNYQIVNQMNGINQLFG